MAGVCGDAVDGAVMTLELAQASQSVRVPQFKHPSSTAAQESWGAGDHPQGAHPVAVGVRDLLVGEKLKAIDDEEVRGKELDQVKFKTKLKCRKRKTWTHNIVEQPHPSST